jgi:hypothetical protein
MDANEKRCPGGWACTCPVGAPGQVRWESWEERLERERVEAEKREQRR